jgi:hypothetical protein
MRGALVSLGVARDVDDLMGRLQALAFSEVGAAQSAVLVLESATVRKFFVNSETALTAEEMADDLRQQVVGWDLATLGDPPYLFEVRLEWFQ